MKLQNKISKKTSFTKNQYLYKKFLCLLIAALILPTTCASSQPFVDVSSSVGLYNENIPSFGNPIWADIDNNGTLDLFIGNHGEEPSLLLNSTEFLFTEVTASSGITASGDRHGAAWGDYDNDGDKDLFISLGGGGQGGAKAVLDQLYQNDGTGNFSDVGALAGVTNDLGRGRSPRWVDFNNDGFLDLFVNNMFSDNLLYKNKGDGTFMDIAVDAGVVKDSGARSSWSDYDKDGDMDFVTVTGRDELWQNNGDETFSEIALLAGFNGDLEFGSTAAWGDFNNDGYNDLYIARGSHDNNNGLVNSKQLIGFSVRIPSSDTLLETGLDFSSSGEELSFDFYNRNCRDSDIVYVGENKATPTTMPFSITRQEANKKPVFLPGTDAGYYVWYDSNGWHLRWSHDGSGASPLFYGKITTNGRFANVEAVNATLNNTLDPQKSIDTLYQNNGDGTFTDVTAAAGVANDGNNRGAIWGDFDNDGDLDLYVVNSGDFLGNKPNTLYRNNGDGTFRDVAAMKGVQALVDGRGDGAAWGDYNNDGLLDLILTNGATNVSISQSGEDDCLSNGPHILLENNGNANKKWLKVTLVGTVSNRDGIGAKINLTSTNTKQFREYNNVGGGGSFSQGSGPVHFGLGADSTIDELIVEWPSGIVQTLNNISSNQHITIEEQINP